MIALQLLALPLSLLILAVAFWFWELAREKRLESLTQHRTFVPPPSFADVADEAAKEADLTATADTVKGMDKAQKTEWMEEKLADGWSQEDVDTFLENRPLLELN